MTTLFTAIRVVARLAVLAAVALLVACSDSPTAPSSTTTASTSTTTASTGVSTQNFEGTLVPGSASFYSFNVSAAGTFTATLASLAATTGPAALTVPVRLGIGVPAGQGCGVTQSVDAAPLLIPQLSAPVAAGIYCVNVADGGGLAVPAVFSVRFSHP